MSATGQAAGSIADLNAGVGIRVIETAGVCTVISAAGTDWLAATKHGLGLTWFVRHSGGNTGRGETIAEAVGQAGGLIEGLQLPQEADCR